jgi:hypothetical protein
MAIKSFKLAQTGSTLAVAPAGTYARWVVFLNYAAAAMYVGDANVSSTQGDYVAPVATSVPGRVAYGPLGDSSMHYDLGQFSTTGTSTQNLVVLYDAMT